MQKHIAIAIIAKLYRCSDINGRDPDESIDSDLSIEYRRVPASHDGGEDGKLENNMSRGKLITSLRGCNIIRRQISEISAFRPPKSTI